MAVIINGYCGLNEMPYIMLWHANNSYYKCVANLLYLSMWHLFICVKISVLCREIPAKCDI